MKGIAASAGFIFFIVLAITSLAGYNVSIFLLAAVSVVLLFVLCVPKLRKTAAVPAALLLSAAALISFCTVYYFDILPASELDGANGDVEAILVALPEENNGKYYYTVKTESIAIKGSPQNIKLRFSSSRKLDVQPYDKIRTNIKFYIPGESVMSSSARYYASNGIYICGYTYETDEITVESGGSRPVNYYFLKMREWLIGNIESVYSGDSSEVMKGILLGDRSGLADEISESFRESGIIHILVVSGIHMSIVSNAVYKTAKKFGFKIRAASFVTCIFIFIFMGITAFSPSVSRAGIMSLIYFLGRAMFKRTEPIVSLGIAAFIILFVRPLEIQNIGFLLSFTSTFGIVTLGDKLSRKFKRNKSSGRIVRWVMQSIITTFSATVFTFPILIYFFQKIYIWGFITNMLVLKAAEIVLVLGGLTALAGGTGIISILISQFAFITDILIKYIIAVAEIISGMPFSSISVTISDMFVIIGLVSVGIGTAMLFTKLKIRWKETLIIFMASLVLFVSVKGAINLTIIKIRILDAGNNTCILVNSGRKAFLIGCGFEYDTFDRLTYLLDQERITGLDAVILPSEYDSETSGLLELSDNIMIGEIFANEKTDLSEITGPVMHITECAEISLYGIISLKIDFSDGNGIVQLDFGEISVLICSKPFSDISGYDCDMLICRAAVPRINSVPDYILVMDSEQEEGYHCTSDTGEIVVKTDGKKMSVYRNR